MENAMTKLPERNVLDGSKKPRTTTGEMKEALADMRNYLADLLGVDSNDKIAARQALGVEEKLNAKADMKTVEALQEEISKRGTPIGSIDYFATAMPPAGYLKADGSAVGRETYPDLFSAIGTTYGEGDGKTTFNLPDLMGRFAEGSTVPGVKKEAGLPNATGLIAGSFAKNTLTSSLTPDDVQVSGTFAGVQAYSSLAMDETAEASWWVNGRINLDLNRASPVYGNSDTVQPSALTLLPCIKAFDAVVNPAQIDVTQLAQDVAGKLDKCGGHIIENGNIRFGDGTVEIGADQYNRICLRSGDSDMVLDNSGRLRLNGEPMREVVAVYRNDSNWYRQWSDGWVEQGGYVVAPATGQQLYSFLLPMADTGYTVTAQIPVGSYYFIGAWPWSNTHFSYQGFGMDGSLISEYGFRWHAFGQGA